jgi:hypothetical protein
MYVFSASYDGQLSTVLTGFWYNDSFRLAAMMPITGVPLATIGVVATASAVRTGLSAWRRTEPTKSWLTVPVLGVVVLALIVWATGGLYLTDHATAAHDGYRGPGTTGNQYFVDGDKDALFKRISVDVPPDAAIVADPFTGVPMIRAYYSNRKIVFNRPWGPETPDYTYLAGHLKDVATDSKVCDIAARYHVQYLLTAPNNIVAPEHVFRKPYAGLVVPASGAGFQLVDQQGTAKLYKITACGAPATR